ncbi:MAG: hypothetical protein ACKO81_10680 [Planctomycetota bacterium]
MFLEQHGMVDIRSHDEAAAVVSLRHPVMQLTHCLGHRQCVNFKAEQLATGCGRGGESFLSGCGGHEGAAIEFELGAVIGTVDAAWIRNLC